MQCAQDQPEASAQDQPDMSPEAQLETEIALSRHVIARLKLRLKHCFEEPASFTAIGEELRQATERLRLIEAELKTRKLEARQEVWWSSGRASSGAAAKLPRSAPRFRDRKARR